MDGLSGTSGKPSRRVQMPVREPTEPTTTASLSLSAKALAVVDAVAEREQRSRSTILRRAVEQWADAQEG